MNQRSHSKRVVSTIALAVIVATFAYAVSWFFRSPKDVESATSQLTSVAQALVVLIAIGFLAGVSGMAAIQVHKNLYPVRGQFHVDYLRAFFGSAWLDLSRLASGRVLPIQERKSPVEQLTSQPIPGEVDWRAGLGADAIERFKQNEELSVDDFPSLAAYEAYLKRTKTTSPSKNKYFTDQAQIDDSLTRQWDAPTEQVVAQLGQLSEFVLARPRGHVTLLRRFAAAPDSSVVDRYVIAVFSPEFDPQFADRKKELDDLAFEVRHYVQRNLDALLLTIGASWRRRVRLKAAVAAGLVGLGALLFTEVGAFVKMSAIFTSTVFGGFFAWFTRDIVAAVEKWRS